MSSRVYIGGIPYEARERDIERFFRDFGRIREVLLKNGFGFVEFEDYRDAKDAVYEMDGKKLLGSRVSIEMARGRPRGRDQDWTSRRRPKREAPIRTKYRVIVENLSSRVSWQDLKDYLREAGEVSFADAHKKYKNEGIVEFASYQDMKNAIRKFDDTDLNGRRIRLIEDKSSGRSRTKSRSSSVDSRRNSQSRSRSRSEKRRSESHRNFKEHSRSHSISRSKSMKRSRSRSKSAHASPEKRSRRDDSASRSRSRSPSKQERSSRSKSRSRSAEGKGNLRGRSRSRS